MAKKAQVSLWNKSTSLLILPNGDEIQPGAIIDLPDEYRDNLGVKLWIEAGYLVDAAEASEPEEAPEE